MDNRDLILILGKTGSGKTFYTKNYIKQYPRRIIIDKQCEYSNGIIIEDFDSFTDFVKSHLTDNHLSIICRMTSDEEVEGVFEVCEIMGNLLLVCEEAGLYISSQSRSSKFLDLCNYGRHYNISIIGIARRCPELHIQFRALVQKIISFKQSLPSDLIYMRSLGFEGLETLPPHQHIEVNY